MVHQRPLASLSNLNLTPWDESDTSRSRRMRARGMMITDYLSPPVFTCHYSFNLVRHPFTRHISQFGRHLYLRDAAAGNNSANLSRGFKAAAILTKGDFHSINRKVYDPYYS